MWGELFLSRSYGRYACPHSSHYERERERGQHRCFCSCGKFNGQFLRMVWKRVSEASGMMAGFVSNTPEQRGVMVFSSPCFAQACEYTRKCSHTMPELGCDESDDCLNSDIVAVLCYLLPSSALTHLRNASRPDNSTKKSFFIRPRTIRFVDTTSSRRGRHG